MSQDSFQRTEYKNQQQQKSLRFKSIHIYNQVEQSYSNQAIHHLQCIYHVRFQIEKKTLAVSDNSGHLLLHHSGIQVILSHWLLHSYL